MFKKLFSTFLAIWPVFAFAQKNVVDEIIWVVGNEPILLSDVEEMRISAELSGTPIENPYTVIPERMAVNNLFIHQAELDSVEVSEADIIRGVDEQINDYIQTYGSREAVEQISGRKISQLRENFKHRIGQNSSAQSD